jgi:hypothetical protein
MCTKVITIIISKNKPRKIISLLNHIKNGENIILIYN